MSMVEYDRSHNPHRPGHYHSHSQSSHRGSPLHQHLDHPSAHSTPSPPYQYAHLPLQQQAPAPTRSTPTSYPSPSYPSPSISAYQYPSQPRGSPYSQSQSLPSFNLPPIRLNPPATSQPLPPPQPQASRLGSPLLGSPLPQPSQSLYYPPHGLPPPAMSHITSSPINQPLRYPLPSVGNSERIMSGGRHKKEIKRRTKTGCLTCRKRRIKCDEAHPTCKNCAKSKRDCLGYDPIFKSQPGPAAIQPAPSTGSAPRLIASAYSMSYLNSNSSIGGQSYAQTISTGSSPASSCEAYEYSSIDPSLDAPVAHPTIASMVEPQTYRPELKRRLDRASPFSSGSDTTRVTPIPRSSTPRLARLQDNQGGNAAKRIKIGDLLSVSSSQPLTPPSSEAASYASPSNSIEGMKNLYKLRFAPALDELLETTWFGKRGSDRILADNQLLEIMAEIFERLKARNGTFVEEEDPSIRRKGRHSGLLWAAVKMCYGTSIPASDNTREDEKEDNIKDEEGLETLRRIHIVEALVTGQPLEQFDASPGSISVDGTEQSSSAKFWKLLGKVAGTKGHDVETTKMIDTVLKSCNQCIEGKESRKILCTIAECRHVNNRRYEPPEDPRQYIKDVVDAQTPAETMKCQLNRRIAARAEGQWTQVIKETTLYC